MHKFDTATTIIITTSPKSTPENVALFLPSLECFLQAGSYTPVFIAASIPLIVGSLLMTTIRQLFPAHSLSDVSLTQSARFLPPLDNLDKPGEEESWDIVEEVLETGRWEEKRGRGRRRSMSMRRGAV